MNLKSFSTKEYKKIDDGTLEIGDIVVVEHRFYGGKNLYQIDAVTKTMAKCSCEKYVARFTRKINSIRSLPRDTWDTNDYRVYRKIN